MLIEVDSARLERELTELAAFSDAPAPAVTRVVFSETDLQARAWLRTLCDAAGLKVRVDAVGNLFARWTGSEVGAGVVATGSHIDAIPNAGRYDGTVGVLGGLEAIRALQRVGFVPQKSIELLLFTSEEPTRFGIGCLGSRLLSGVLAGEKAAALHDSNGASLDDVKSKAGFTGDIAAVRLPPNYFDSFVELHIEQGPLLEQTQHQIGLVTSIAGPASLQVVLEGEGGHAGAVLMPGRRDALTAAAEVVLAVERLAIATGAPDTVATTGICRVFPGAVNSIPSRVTLAIDVRDTDLARRDSVLAGIRQATREIAGKRNLQSQVDLLNADHPATCDGRIIETLRKACEAQNLSYMEMVSRAYHDSLFMSQIAPTAMLFIPCRAGVSHRPDESSSIVDIANGVAVLAHTLARLAS